MTRLKVGYRPVEPGGSEEEARLCDRFAAHYQAHRIADTLGDRRPLPRTFDAASLNAVANDPGVRPGLGVGDAPLDLGRVLTDPQHIAFADERGGFIFEHQGSGRYEMHTLLRPEARGRTALDLAAACFHRLFVETPCSELVTRVPANLPHVVVMARKAGFRDLWTLPASWVGPGGARVDLHAFVMSLDDWMQRDAELIAAGEDFHDLLRAAAAMAGDDSPLHPHEDAQHERAAGMAFLMAKAGNHHKAVWAYGRWARLANYRPIQLISEAPAVYDTGNALVQVTNGQPEVLKWLPQQ